MKLSEARKVWHHYLLLWRECAYEGPEWARELLGRDLKIERLEAKLSEYTKLADIHEENQDALLKEVEKLEKWVADLHTGMYINCVYCGHRYGPDSEEGVSIIMADVLHEHISVCPDHPLSVANARISEMRTDLGGWLQLARRWYLDADFRDPKRPRLSGVNTTERILNVPFTQERKE